MHAACMYNRMERYSLMGSGDIYKGETRRKGKFGEEEREERNSSSGVEG